MSTFDAEHVRNLVLLSQKLDFRNELIDFRISLEIWCNDDELEAFDNEELSDLLESHDVAFVGFCFDWNEIKKFNEFRKCFAVTSCSQVVIFLNFLGCTTQWCSQEGEVTIIFPLSYFR